MKILGVERDATACNHYRVLQPLMKIREQGLANAMTIKEQDFFFDINFATEKVAEADVVLFQRPASEEWLNFIKVAQKLGKVVVVDYDDDPFNTSPLSPAYRFFGIEEVMYEWEDGQKDMLWSEDMVGSKGETDFFNLERNIRNRDLFKVNFKKSDLITCTTSVLQESFFKIKPQVTVLPNVVDFSLYPQLDCVKKDVRILWQGGSSHYEDLWMVSKPLCKILKENPNVKFVYYGDMRFTGLFKDAPQDQIEWHSWTPHTVYPYKLATLNADIGLCPLVDNVFNRNKSAIKWMEYSIMNIATIASDIEPYSPVIEHNQTGLLIKDDEWYDAITSMIKGVQKRKKMAKQAYDEVFTNHNADTKAHLWVEAYEKTIKSELVEA